jgi:hypothetical protein
MLYLDTARLGLMTAGAQAAHVDFVRLAAQEGGTPFFERFLRWGLQAWGARAAARYPALASWQGVAALKERLRLLAGSPPGLPVLLASRSVALMRLAAQLLCHPCRHVLITDLGWPPYYDILHAECCRTGRTLSSVLLRDDALSGRLAEKDIIDRIRRTYLHKGCDGLFLTAVSNLGVRLPIAAIVRAVEADAEVRFVVIDGAQEFGHLPGDLGQDCCDLYLTGVHKWFRAYNPLGVAFYGRARSRQFIETLVAQGLTSGQLDDPLLRFTTQLETGALDGTTETVNLAPLFSCQGATEDALGRPASLQEIGSTRQVNRRRLSSVALMAGWRPLVPCSSLQTGILLLQPERAAACQRSAQEMRAACYASGVALTAYQGGLIRLSLPEVFWRPGATARLGTMLRSLA